MDPNKLRLTARNVVADLLTDYQCHTDVARSHLDDVGRGCYCQDPDAPPTPCTCPTDDQRIQMATTYSQLAHAAAIAAQAAATAGALA